MSWDQDILIIQVIRMFLQTTDCIKVLLTAWILRMLAKELTILVSWGINKGDKWVGFFLSQRKFKVFLLFYIKTLPATIYIKNERHNR